MNILNKLRNIEERLELFMKELPGIPFPDENLYELINQKNDYDDVFSFAYDAITASQEDEFVFIENLQMKATDLDNICADILDIIYYMEDNEREK